MSNAAASKVIPFNSLLNPINTKPGKSCGYRKAYEVDEEDDSFLRNEAVCMHPQRGNESFRCCSLAYCPLPGAGEVAVHKYFKWFVDEKFPRNKIIFENESIIHFSYEEHYFVAIVNIDNKCVEFYHIGEHIASNFYKVGC